VTSTNAFILSPLLIVAAGATLDVSGGPNGGIILGNGRTISGSGAIKGNLTVGNRAVLAPGGSIGTLTFSNSLILVSGCSNIFEISHSPLTNDAANVLGQATLAGTLIVTNIGGAQLAAGDTFQLFNAASFTGAFASVQLPPLPVGLIWNTNLLNTAGTISVALNTTPVIGAISISGNGLGLSGTGGVGVANFYLLSSTNLTVPLSNWTRLQTNQFDGSGNFNLTNALDPSLPQSFYRLQLP